MVLARGVPYNPADVKAESLLLGEPLSFWGGVDPATGEIVDNHHPQAGARISGKVLIMPRGRGSSGASSVLTESVRAGVGPAAIITEANDPMLVVGALVISELYPHKICPVVVVKEGYEQLRDAVSTTVEADGTIEQD